MLRGDIFDSIRKYCVHIETYVEKKTKQQRPPASDGESVKNDRITRRRFTVTVSGGAAVLLAGCLGGGDGYEEGEYTADIIDRDAEETVADYHGHWHGELSAIPVGGYVSLGARIETADDEVPLDEDGWRLDAVAESEGGDASVESHGDHVQLYGESAGEVSVAFQLLGGDDVEWETGSIPAVVEES